MWLLVLLLVLLLLALTLAGLVTMMARVELPPNPSGCVTPNACEHP